MYNANQPWTVDLWEAKYWIHTELTLLLSINTLGTNCQSVTDDIVSHLQMILKLALLLGAS